MSGPGVTVGVDVSVGSGVGVDVGVGVGVSVGVGVIVGVAVAVMVGVEVLVGVAVEVAVAVGVGVCVGSGVGLAAWRVCITLVWISSSTLGPLGLQLETPAIRITNSTKSPVRLIIPLLYRVFPQGAGLRGNMAAGAMRFSLHIAPALFWSGKLFF